MSRKILLFEVILYNQIIIQNLVRINNYTLFDFLYYLKGTIKLWKTHWLYDEFVQTETDFSDIKKIEIYDLKMSKFRNYNQEADLLLNMLNIDSSHVLLDIGTSHFAIEVFKRCKKVYAIDVLTVKP